MTSWCWSRYDRGMLEGFRISDYLSFGEMQTIAPLGKVNVFVGPNNSGKSNVLRFVNGQLRGRTNQIRGNGDLSTQPAKQHSGRGKPTCFDISVMCSLEEFASCLTGNFSIIRTIYQELFRSGKLWVSAEWPDITFCQQAVTWVSTREWQRLWSNSFGKSGGRPLEEWVSQTLSVVTKFVPPPRDVFEIPITRRADTDQTQRIQDGAVVDHVLSGRGAIKLLAAMQNPQYANREAGREKFLRVRDFVRVITDDHTAEVDVPHEQNEIGVRLKGQPFRPLAELGSGIEQVVLHAIAATSVSDSIITFEEPELHLHPILQRQLLAYLALDTSNQYFIATHSAHMIDSLHTKVFHVRLVEGETRVQYAGTDAQRHRICSDLGYRPSDLVQANCVVWVEGPSDLVYLRHWIKQVDSHLVEGVHFSMMIYAGKLLSHLSASASDNVDASIEHLIQLRNINRYVAVVIDSDLNSGSGKIRDTKRRLAEEISDNGGFVWITSGREIENYVPEADLKHAVDQVAPGRAEHVKSGKYAKVLPTVKDGATRVVDKIAVAKAVVEHSNDISRFDLRERLGELVGFIREANGLPVT